ncbi:MAG TPA: hypothetical protein VGL65_07520 [Gemmatimonadales bacterium]|jgi:hypothetical protein
MTANRPGFVALALLGASLLTVPTIGPSQPQRKPPELRGSLAQEQPVDIDAIVYGAVVDSLIVDPNAYTSRPTAQARIMNGIYWYPWIQDGRAIGARLGPAPGLILSVGQGRIPTSSVDEPEVRRTSRSGGNPIFVLGPIDWLGDDEALVRIGVWNPKLGFELFRSELRRVRGKWTVAWLHIEGRS